jgi:N4-gp56 family major capsid protein
MVAPTIPASPSSLFNSPVDDTNVGLLSRVSTRISGGAQAANAAGGKEWAENFVTTAYDLVLGQAYRQALVFDPFATKQPSRLTHSGAVVSFGLDNDIPDDVAGATLSEDFDVLPSKFKTAHVEVGMAEYGRVITRTNLLRGTSMVAFDPRAANKIARNAVSTMDRLALAKIYAAGGVSASSNTATFGTNGGVPTAVAPVAGFPTQTLQKIAQTFQENDVEPFSNGLYAAVISPAEVTKLRQESDAGGWRYYQINQDSGGGTGSISRRVLGEYEDFMFLVSNRLTAGKSIYAGADGLAKVFPQVEGFGPQPTISAAPVVDKLRRFMTVGWLWTGGYGRYKAEGLMTSDLTT